MKNKKGFTLIELLVVVLIIGILAAIALPQYRISVEKARAAEAITKTRILAEGVNIYMLTHDKKPDSFNDLDIELTNMTKIDNGAANRSEVISDDKFSYYIDKNNNMVVARKKTSPSDTNYGQSLLTILYSFDQDPRTNSMALSRNSVVCAVKTGTEKEEFYTKVCQALGAKSENSVLIGGYVHYKIN